ncbi:MAG: hypothetical protein ACKVQC_00425, partial [Elusimicrobiota bacterium]
AERNEYPKFAFLWRGWLKGVCRLANLSLTLTLSPRERGHFFQKKWALIFPRKDQSLFPLARLRERARVRARPPFLSFQRIFKLVV